MVDLELSQSFTPSTSCTSGSGAFGCHHSSPDMYLAYTTAALTAVAKQPRYFSSGVGPRATKELAAAWGRESLVTPL